MGMSSIAEVKRCIKWINQYHNKIIILYCVSGYPTPINEMNIRSINILKRNFKKNLIGLSDHTNSIYSSFAASVLGVAVIEKHFVIDDKKTFDSKFSIIPSEMSKLAMGIKKISKSLGKEKFF